MMGDYDDEARREDAVREEAWIDDLWRDDLRREPEPWSYYGGGDPWLARQLKKLAKKVAEWLKYSLVIALLLSLALSAVPAQVAASPGGEYAFSYTLLGLSKDLYGVHVEPGWMLIVGQDGLITEARKVDGAWVYEPIAIGGATLTDVIWSGDVGLAIGEGRVVMLQRVGKTITSRDLPFLADSFLIASWSPKRDFAILLSGTALYYYEPGWTMARVLNVGMRPLMVLKPYNVAKDDYAMIVTSKEAEVPGIGRGISLLLVRVYKDGVVETEALAAGKDLQAALTNFITIASNMTAQRQLPQSPPLLLSFILRRLFELSPIQIKEIELLVGTYGVHADQEFYAVITRGKKALNNLALIYIGGQARMYSLAFPTLNIYPYDDGGLRFAVVGAGGGVAIINPEIDHVIYCSVPSAYKIRFLDRETAAITSPYGLFIYNYTSVEYLPMPIPPAHIYVSPDGAKVYVSDGAGNIYELVRPAPWMGGLVLKYYTEGGYTLDIEPAEHGEVVLVRSGRFAGREGAGLEEFSRGLTGYPERVSGAASGGREGGEATLGAESALFLLSERGLSRLRFEEAPKGFEEYRVVDMARAKAALILVGITGGRASLPPLLVENLNRVTPLDAPATSYYRVVVHPSEDFVLIVGESTALLYNLRQGTTEPLPVPATRYEAAEFSSDGTYALIGGVGTLLLYDGEVHDIAQRFVVRYLYLAAKPEDRTRFLASTSLGLMELRMVARPNPGANIYSGAPKSEVVGSGAVKVTYPLRASDRVKVVNVIVNCLPTCAAQDYPPSFELKPLEPATLSITLLFEESRQSRVNGTAYVTLVAEGGEKYQLPPARLMIYFREEVDVLGAIMMALPIVILLFVILLIVLGLRRRSRGRVREAPRDWRADRREERPPEPGGGEDMREVVWD